MEWLIGLAAVAVFLLWRISSQIKETQLLLIEIGQTVVATAPKIEKIGCMVRDMRVPAAEFESRHGEPPSA